MYELVFQLNLVSYISLILFSNNHLSNSQFSFLSCSVCKTFLLSTISFSLDKTHVLISTFFIFSNVFNLYSSKF